MTFDNLSWITIPKRLLSKYDDTDLPGILWNIHNYSIVFQTTKINYGCSLAKGQRYALSHVNSLRKDQIVKLDHAKYTKLFLNAGPNDDGVQENEPAKNHAWPSPQCWPDILELAISKNLQRTNENQYTRLIARMHRRIVTACCWSNTPAALRVAVDSCATNFVE